MIYLLAYIFKRNNKYYDAFKIAHTASGFLSRKSSKSAIRSQRLRMSILVGTAIFDGLTDVDGFMTKRRREMCNFKRRIV